MVVRRADVVRSADRLEMVVVVVSVEMMTADSSSFVTERRSVLIDDTDGGWNANVGEASDAAARRKA